MRITYYVSNDTQLAEFNEFVFIMNSAFGDQYTIGSKVGCDVLHDIVYDEPDFAVIDIRLHTLNDEKDILRRIEASNLKTKLFFVHSITHHSTFESHVLYKEGAYGVLEVPFHRAQIVEEFEKYAD